MKRYLSLTSIWIFSATIAILTSTVEVTEADPTDDFSFSLGGVASETDVYRVISEERVKEILSDRLDLFPQSQVPRLARHLLGICKTYRFDPAFILSLIQVESGFRVRVASPVGALGLMQVMLPTANFVVQNFHLRTSGFENFQLQSLQNLVITPEILTEPFVNITIGVAYLASLRDYYKGLLPYHVVAAYNVGPGRLDELLARKSFRPVETKKYFHAIRRGVPQFRFYQKKCLRSPFQVRNKSSLKPVKV